MTLDHPLPVAPGQLEELSAEGLGESRRRASSAPRSCGQPQAHGRPRGAGALRARSRSSRSLPRAVLDPRARPARSTRRPARAHWLGTDDGGVDMLSLLIAGTRVSLEVGFAAALVAMLIGGTVGVLSGFFGGIIDIVLMRITDIFLVIPDIPLMIVDGGDLRPQPREHHHHHRHHLLDEHGPADPRPGEERARAGVREAGAIARGGQPPAGVQARAAAGGAAADRQHGADGRAGDLRRDATSRSSAWAIRARSRGGG